MSLLEIEAVESAGPDGRLWGCSLDRPVPGTRAEARALDVAGWVLGRSAPAVAVELVQGNAVLRRVPLRARPDVAVAFPGRPGAERCGFETAVAVRGPAAEIELDVQAVLRDGARVPLGAIRASRRWRALDDGAGGELVSVVIPCYNQAHYLGDAIGSALGQSHPQVEVVVVDDGSDDNTALVAARYPGVRCARQDNRGLAAARNTGMRCSNGSYLVFLDADDRLLPNALEAGLACLRAHPACAFAAGHHRLIAADGSLLPTTHPPSGQGDPYTALLRNNFILMPAMVMYRRAVFETVKGFDTTVSPAADYDLYLRIAREFPICCHDQIVAEYRRHGANMSRNADLMLKAALTVLQAQWKYVRENGRYREAYREGWRGTQDEYGNPLVDEVSNNLRAHEWRQAMSGLLTLFRYYPRGLVSVLRAALRDRLATWRAEPGAEEAKVTRGAP